LVSVQIDWLSVTSHAISCFHGSEEEKDILQRMADSPFSALPCISVYGFDICRFS